NIHDSTSETVLITGTQAIAQAVVLARPKVIPAYPITPQTVIVETISQFVEEGKLKAEFVPVESEHSAMAAAIGSSLAGVRTFTATASHGLLYMGELVFWAGMTRVPIVLANVNRSLNPWNIWPDHQDSMAFRDAGWIQFYVKNNQEALDTVLHAFKLAEHHKVWMPVMVCLDGFILSHTSSLVQIPKQEIIDDFLGEFKPLAMLDNKAPFAHGSLTDAKGIVELRESLMEGMKNAHKLIPRITKEYHERVGRHYGDYFEITGDIEDAKVVIISMGTLGEETQMAIRYLEEQGIKNCVGMRLRTFRPFPKEEIIKALESVEKILIIDRAASFGNEGQISIEIKAALFDKGLTPQVYPLIKGLGGSDVNYKEIGKEVKKIL
ncbi:MAG: pyruvate ferredoxin oxidoreductase, partial [Candidatus Hodarchaeota archaeon]